MTTNTLEDQEDQMRKKALLFCMFQAVAASTIPAIVYAFLLKLDNYGIGPIAWTTWGISIFVSLIGVLAHSAADTTLTITHLVINTLLTTALAGYVTAWSFIIQLQCSISQIAFSGCASCSCANTNTCTAASLTSNIGCTSCKAPYADVCTAVKQPHNLYLLSFWGLAALTASILPIIIDIRILVVMAAHRSDAASRIQAICVAVEQQTRLISAGDKPTVTPGTLTDWVGALLSTKERQCKIIAEKCRVALRGRGYELPIKGEDGSTALTGRNGTYGTGGGLFRAATHSTTSFDDGTDQSLHPSDLAELGGLNSGRPRLKSQQIVPVDL